MWEKMCFMLMDAIQLLSADTNSILGEYLKTPSTKKSIFCLWCYFIWKKEDTAVRILDTPQDFNSVNCLLQIH